MNFLNSNLKLFNLPINLQTYLSRSFIATKILSDPNMNDHFKSIDHIAIRTLEKKFYNSYTFKQDYKINCFNKSNDLYTFSKYDVLANWYKQENLNNSFNYNRIFASWYNGNYENISENIKELIIKNKQFTYNNYLDLNNVNQYIAWTYLFKHDINHIAILVDDISVVTEKLSKEYKFNNEGGIYKISQDKNLIQTSTMADMIEFKFEDKTEKIPYSFIEFVERKNNRDGFEQDNANKIFSSTKNY